MYMSCQKTEHKYLNWKMKENRVRRVVFLFIVLNLIVNIVI
jgi:hypothetical protein